MSDDYQPITPPPRREFPRATALLVAVAVGFAGDVILDKFYRQPPQELPVSAAFDDGLQTELVIHRRYANDDFHLPGSLELGKTKEGEEYCLVTDVPGPSQVGGGYSLHHFLDLGCDAQADVTLELRSDFDLKEQENYGGKIFRNDWSPQYATWVDVQMRQYFQIPQVQKGLNEWRKRGR